MREKVRLPKLDQDMTEGTVAEWLVAVGDEVAAGQPVVEVETDKVTTEVEAPIAGVVEAIFVPAGKIAPVAAELCSIATADEVGKPPADAPEPPPAAGEEPAPPADAPAPPPRLAVPARTADAGQRIPLDPGDRSRPEPPSRPAPAGGSAAQRALVRTVEASWQIPQFPTRVSVPAQPLLDAVAQADGEGSARVSVTHVLLKLAAAACRDVPIVNAHYVDGTRVPRDAIDLNVLVQAEDGLRNPCVRDVAGTSLAELAADVHDLASACRDGSIAHADLVAGSMTISNVGMFGVDDVAPLLFPPQVAILGVGRISGDSPSLSATLVVDHRALNGVDAARWLDRFRQLCEDPSEALAAGGAHV